MPDTDLIKKSITAGDYAETPRSGVINFMLPWYPGMAQGLPPEPPGWWSKSRDVTLRSTVLYEDMWAAAIGIAITKIASSSWEVDSEIQLRARRGQDILNDSDIVKTFAKGLRDYLTTDNGQFLEIVRVSKSPVSRIVGLAHLDSLRCTRTGDPDIPIIYIDRRGYEHEVRAENVIALSDMPDPGDTWFGVGNCAASRSYRSIYKLHVIDRYVGEKVSGRRPLALYFVNAVSRAQLEGAMQAAEESGARQGILSYMGAVVIPLMDASTPPQVSTVPLAELPDRFNRKEEFDIGLYSYADNIGLDVQDLQPLTGQPLGTGAQSQVLDEKAKGKGLVIWKKDLAYELNQKVFDDMTTFAWIEKDYRDMERQAAIANARANASKTRIDAGITDAKQELQVLVDLDELPNEFLPEDVTGETLSDTEKPDKEQTAGEGAEMPMEEAPEETPEEETPKAETKETPVGKFTSRYWKAKAKEKELGIEPIDWTVTHSVPYDPSFSLHNGKTFPGIKDAITTGKEADQKDLDALMTGELNAAIDLYESAGGKAPDELVSQEAMKELVKKACKTPKKKRARKIKRDASQTS